MLCNTAAAISQQTATPNLAPIEHLTRLRAAGRLILTKRIRCVDGVYIVDAGPMPKMLTISRLIVRDVRALATWLEGSLRHDARSAVIRGNPIVPIDSNKRYRRTKHVKDGMPPTFGEHRRRWLMLDIDDYRIDLPPVTDIDTAYRVVIDALPPEFNGVTCWAQLSSTAGLPGRNGIKAHLWFWLSRPVGEKELKVWLKDCIKAKDQPRAPIDPATFDCIQWHYCADPIFEPASSDPFLDLPRAKLFEGERDQVEVPAIEIPEPTKPPPSHTRAIVPRRPAMPPHRIAATLGAARRERDGWLGKCPRCGERLLITSSGSIECLGPDPDEEGVDGAAWPPCTWDELRPQLVLLGVTPDYSVSARAMRYARAMLASVEPVDRHNILRDKIAQLYGFVEHHLITATCMDRMITETASKLGLPEPDRPTESLHDRMGQAAGQRRAQAAMGVLTRDDCRDGN